MAVTYTLYLGGVPRLDLNGPVNLPSRYTGIEIVKLERSYDEPTKLTFMLIGEWAPYPFGADVLVELYQGAVRVFEGLTDLPSVIFTADNQKAVQYTAEDRRAAMDQVIAKTSPEQLPDFPPPERVPQINLPAGPLSVAVDALLVHVGVDMLEKGLAAVVNYVGSAETLLSRGITVSDASIDRAFIELAASAPGCRVMINPSGGGAPRYTMVNLFGTATRDVYIDETRISELPIQASTKGRAGAVKIYGGLTHGSTSARFNHHLELVPAWDPEKEKEWSQDRAGGLMNIHPFIPEQEELFKVFRTFLFRYPGASQEVPMNSTIGCVLRKGRNINGDGNDLDNYFETAGIDTIDFEAGTVTLREPAVRRATPSVRSCPGLQRGGNVDEELNPQAYLAWSDEDTANVDITITPIRYPETGFAGRAVALSPIKCAVEMVVTAPPGVDRNIYAVQAWMAYSEPIISGSLPINEDLPSDLFFLGRRINLRTRSHGGTGFEEMAAPIMGVSVTFGPHIQSELEFSRDFSALVSGGQG